MTIYHFLYLKDDICEDAGERSHVRVRPSRAIGARPRTRCSPPVFCTLAHANSRSPHPCLSDHRNARWARPPKPANPRSRPRACCACPRTPRRRARRSWTRTRTCTQPTRRTAPRTPTARTRTYMPSRARCTRAAACARSWTCGARRRCWARGGRSRTRTRGARWSTISSWVRTCVCVWERERGALNRTRAGVHP
jgi:hypothetical protein